MIFGASSAKNNHCLYHDFRFTPTMPWNLFFMIRFWRLFLGERGQTGPY